MTAFESDPGDEQHDKWFTGEPPTHPETSDEVLASFADRPGFGAIVAFVRQAPEA